MKENNPFYNFYPLLKKEINQSMISDFVNKSVESLVQEGEDEKKSYEKIKSYFIRLSDEITNVCVEAKFAEKQNKIEPSNDDTFLKVSDIAVKLDITKQQVHNLIKDGKIKSTKISERGTRIAEKDFKDFLKSRKLK